MIRIFQGWVAIFAVTAVLPYPASAQNANFHNAPASAKALQNPYQGQQPPNARALFHLRCARCHGENGEGSGNIPPLKAERIKAVTAGEIFWFITKGDVKHDMPSWAMLPKEQRWKIVTYVKAMGTPAASASSASTAGTGKLNLPATKPPFTDFRA